MRADKPAIFLVGRWGTPLSAYLHDSEGQIVAEETAWGCGDVADGL